jgi:two-component system sensor histidine kinase CreC
MNDEPRSPGRAVLFVHHLISAVAPSLHSLRWKVFLLCLAAVFLPGLYFAWKVGQGIERSHLRSTEQGMIDTGLVLAETWGQVPLEDLPDAREILRTVFSDTSPNLRIVFYDPQGRVLQDTAQALVAGSDESGQRDVSLAMRGEYGARWERGSGDSGVVLHSTIPVLRDGRILGLVGVVKSTADVRRSVIRSLKDLALPAFLAFLLAALVSFALSTYLTRIIGGLARRAERVAAGEQGVRLETWTKSELGDLARALEQMRRKLEGKEYVEDMALTLSHEIKTPLAAIRGAADVLEQTDEPEVKRKFLGNIFAEVDRLSAIVTNFLALSRIESAPADPGARASLSAVADEVAATFRARAHHVEFAAQVSPDACFVAMPSDQLRRLMEALLENAFQFTPAGGRVFLMTDGPSLTVRDDGPGIPTEVRAKIFDRFFTTVNPLTGRRGTGLGLAIVRSLAERHGARITLGDGPGTSVTVEFTRIS